MLSGGISAGDTSTFKGVTIERFVTPDGSGTKHIRIPMCTTTMAAGANCDTPFKWATPFADANYTLSCTLNGDGSGGATLLNVFSKTAVGATLRLSNIAAHVETGVANCIAMHD
jgi:hypothetical protein